MAEMETKVLCAKLLQDEKLAEKAMAKLNSAVQGKSAHEAAVLAAQHCRKLLIREDSSAFEDIKSSLMISEQLAFSEIRDDDEAGCYAYLVAQLSHRHRFAFLLKTEAGLTAEEIAKCLKLKPAEVESDLAAAWNTMTRTLDSMQKDKEEPVPMYAALRTKLTESLAGIDLPEQAAVKTYINTAAAAPKRKKVKKPAITAPTPRNYKKMGIMAACFAVICAAIVIAVSVATGGDYAGGYYADIEIENYGTVTVQLNEKAAPVTVENFIELAESDYYDGKTFHRIMEGFMMQGGSENGDGKSVAGAETIVGEFAANGYNNPLTHTRGAISMARASDYDSGSTQFFIVHQDNQESLDGLYAAFGYVVSGMDIVDEICETAQPTDDNGTIPAEEQPVIKDVTIREA